MGQQAPSELPAPGDVLEGKIEIVRQLGQGGMGAVYEGLHRKTGRRVAVKVIRPEIATDAQAVSRFLQEALVCGKVRHPNVVNIFDASTADGRPYLVMELLEGETLAHRIARDGPLPFGDALDIIAATLTGVAAVHDCGIVHRDLKPDNLFLPRPGSDPAIVKVMDFGISKLSAGDSLADTAVQLTGSDTVLGTPYYMSPEQARGVPDIDGRTDVYAAGAVLFHMLTGRPPFVADSYTALIACILLDDLPPLREHRPDAPLGLDGLVRRAMSKKREDRFAGAEEMRDLATRQTRVVVNAAILFTDLDGFLPFATSAPLEEVEKVLEAWEAAHRRVVAKYGGVLRLVVADEMLMTLPTPDAAVLAWLDLMDLTTYPEQVRSEIRFRAGLAQGDVRIVRSATYGPAINEAAQLTAKAEVGTLRTSPTVLAGLGQDATKRIKAQDNAPERAVSPRMESVRAAIGEVAIRRG